MLVFVAVLVLLGAASSAIAAEPGHLLVIGGGLRPDNSTVYSRLIQHGGGKGNARFAIFPTASDSPNPARQVKLALSRYGVTDEQIRIMDLTVANSEQRAGDAEFLREIDRATVAYFTGGDQRRILAALIAPDGRERATLGALRNLRARGGVIAGSSAGAAMQSKLMLCVSGLPDESMDEGMDALDFGLTTDTQRRGLQVSHGLGFFEHGIIDQHFHQYRGRLSRLSRAAIEHQTRFGFGIDENTAIDVAADGTLEVLGPGCLTIVDASNAKLFDGPFGCRLLGLRISLLEEGDRFDTRKGTPIIAPGRNVIAAGTESLNGNFVIPDIAGEGAVYHALTSGLADNTRQTQIGVTMKYSGHYAHGYQFTFTKTATTQSFAGYVNGVWGYAVLGARLDIEPISQRRRSPADDSPGDIATQLAGEKRADTRRACEAIAFRGVMLADEQQRFRPNEPITRGELATAIARTLHLEPPRGAAKSFADVPANSPLYADVEKVITAKLLDVDHQQRFRPNEPIARQHATPLLKRLAELYGTKPGAALFDDTGSPEQPWTRAETALGLYRVIGFPW